MNFKNKLNQIKVVLGLEVKLASAKLEDGTVVEAENFEPGYPVFVINADGTKSPAPVGEHKLDDGTTIVVDEMGNIASVVETETVATEGAEASAEGEVPVAAAAEDMVPASETPAEIAKKESAVNETMKKMVVAMEELSAELGKMKTKMAEMESKFEKFSKIPGASKFPSVTKEAFEAIDPLEAKIAALQELKKDNFFVNNK